jgi:hypothetical protein
LREVQRAIGAKVDIPPGAEQEPVIADVGPLPPREALTALLNGSSYNVILIGAGHDLSQVTRIVLTPRGSEGTEMPANYAPASVTDSAADVPEPPPPVQEAPPEPVPPPPDAPPPPQ